MTKWPTDLSLSFFLDGSCFNFRRPFFPAASVFGNRSGARRLFQNVVLMVLIPLISRSTAMAMAAAENLWSGAQSCGSSHRFLVRTRNSWSSTVFEWAEGERMFRVVGNGMDWLRDIACASYEFMQPAMYNEPLSGDKQGPTIQLQF